MFKQNSTFFSEYGYVAYQIKGNEAYNIMVVNIMPDTLCRHTLDPRDEVKGQNIFSDSSHVAYQIKGIERRSPCKQKYSILTHTLDPSSGVKRSNYFF